MNDKANVLVVGGAGCIGSHTTLSLVEAGNDVTVYDNFSTGHRDAVFGDRLVEGELSDRKKLVDVMKKYDIDTVVHFAALIEAGQSMVEPLSFYRNNTAGTLVLLEAMQDANVDKIVFSSTAAVYGDQAAKGLLNETLPRSPINPYGHSKAMVDVMLETASQAHGLQAIALRYFNAAGADPQCRTGERHDPETHLIPLVIEAAQGKRPSIKVFGADYSTPDGTCIRDYIHVCDLARRHVAAVDLWGRDRNVGFKAINLGTGQGHSVKTVIQTVAEVSGLIFPIVEEERRPGDPAMLVADASAAKGVLNWRAERSDIKTIVEDAWRFSNA